MLDFSINDEVAAIGFTSRDGGVSDGCYGSLNLAFHVGDDVKKVLKNREILAQHLSVTSHDLIFMNQIHGDSVLNIDDAFLCEYRAKFDAFCSGKLDLGAAFPSCDALVTNISNIALCVMVADCAPVLFYDKKRRVIAVAHAGRAGVMSKICSKTIEKMQGIYQSKVSDIEVFVGANIKVGCYEVGDLWLGEFERFRVGKNFDINAALTDELRSMGVKNLDFSSACSHCDERYFSYRRDGASGRFAGFAMLKG